MLEKGHKFVLKTVQQLIQIAYTTGYGSVFLKTYIKKDILLNITINIFLI